MEAAPVVLFSFTGPVDRTKKACQFKKNDCQLRRFGIVPGFKDKLRLCQIFFRFTNLPKAFADAAQFTQAARKKKGLNRLSVTKQLPGSGAKGFGILQFSLAAEQVGIIDIQFPGKWERK